MSVKLVVDWAMAGISVLLAALTLELVVAVGLFIAREYRDWRLDK